jgi:hypothetical protein
VYLVYLLIHVNSAICLPSGLFILRIFLWNTLFINVTKNMFYYLFYFPKITYGAWGWLNILVGGINYLGQLYTLLLMVFFKLWIAHFTFTFPNNDTWKLILFSHFSSAVNCNERVQSPNMYQLSHMFADFAYNDIYYYQDIYFG